jgi:hypothetical protein
VDLDEISAATARSGWDRVPDQHHVARNASGLTPHVDPLIRPYNSRPFLVLGTGRFTDAYRRWITDSWLSKLPLVSAVDQLAGRTNLLSSIDLTARLRALYRV